MKKRVLTITVLCAIFMLPLTLHAEWKELHALPDESVWASSEFAETIRGETVVYSVDNLFDNDPSTCWVEGASGKGIGENVIIQVDQIAAEISFINGFSRSENLFHSNGRIRELQISLAACFTAPGLVSETDHQLYFWMESSKKGVITLEDTMKEQTFAFPISWEEQDRFWYDALEEFKEEFPMFYDEILYDLGETAEDDLILAVYSMYCIRLEIASVYPGAKYEDTCLSEISFVLE